MKATSLVKSFLPYGVVRHYLAKHRSLNIDYPLFYYPGWAKRLKRILKFSLPYGIIIPYRERVFQNQLQGAVVSEPDSETAEAMKSQAGDRSVLVLSPLPSAAELESQLRLVVAGATGDQPIAVTVVTVVFNLVKGKRLSQFRECLDSVQAQSGVKLEHLIVDGGSTDGTLAELESYAAAHPSLRVYSAPDRGIYDAMNRGLVLARGKYVTFLNSDDRYHDGLGLKEAVAQLEATGAEFSYAPVLMQDEAGHILNHPNSHPDVNRLCHVMAFSHQSMVLKTEALRKLGGFDTSYRSAADYDSVLRMVFAGYHAVKVDRAYVTFRTGGYSWTNMAESQAECGRMFANLYGKFLGYPLTPEAGREMYVTLHAPMRLEDLVLEHVIRAFGFEGERNRPKCRLGVRDRWNVIGLYEEEHWGAWGGRELRIYATLPEDLRDRDLELTLNLGAFSDELHPATVSIKVNGQDLGELAIDNFQPQPHVVKCPAALVKDGKLVIDLESAYAVRPTGETRTLGISFAQLEIAADAAFNLINKVSQLEHQVQTLSATLAERDAQVQRLTEANEKLATSQICNLCGNVAELKFGGRILNQYDIRYYYCAHCGHLQTEKPWWLEEAYGSALSLSDTGIVQRNEYARDVVKAVLATFFEAPAKVLEYAGGYGLLTRMLRDAGVDCLWYDKFAKPIFAEGLVDDGKRRCDLVTAFEALEHFENPLAELEKIFARSGSLIFTEELLPEPVPAPSEWWYYCLEHGQHLNLYSLKTLEYLAHRFGKRLVYHDSVGMLTDKDISEADFANCIDNCHAIAEAYQQPSLTVSDMQLMISKMAEK